MKFKDLLKYLSSWQYISIEFDGDKIYEGVLDDLIYRIYGMFGENPVLGMKADVYTITETPVRTKGIFIIELGELEDE